MQQPTAGEGWEKKTLMNWSLQVSFEPWRGRKFEKDVLNQYGTILPDESLKSKVTSQRRSATW